MPPFRIPSWLAGAFVLVPIFPVPIVTPPASGPTIVSCPVFPADNVWNARVDALPVDSHSADYVASIGEGDGLKADFGAGADEGAPVGIPYVVVPADQAAVPVRFAASGDGAEAAGDESDPGPYPVPRGAPVEGGDDRHVLVVQQGSCMLYELYGAVPNDDASWSAAAGARFDLRSHALRPEGWTSADGAGLPIFPGLVRREEVVAGKIGHALRFTAPQTRNAHTWPARHTASDKDAAALPPMGQRFRLKANVDITRFSSANQVILQALKTYGMMLADNGSPWFLTGAPDEKWDNDDLAELRRIKGADFEAVDTSSLVRDENSGQVR